MCSSRKISILSQQKGLEFPGGLGGGGGSVKPKNNIEMWEANWCFKFLCFLYLFNSI